MIRGGEHLVFVFSIWFLVFGGRRKK